MKTLFLIFLAFLPFSAGANDLVGSQAKKLASGEVSADRLQAALRFCDELILLSKYNKESCLKLVRGNLSNSGIDHCLGDKNIRGSENMLECFEDVSGFDFPAEYLQACSGTRKSRQSERKACLQYLAKASSSFDLESFRFCVRSHLGEFMRAKPCLNMIRDREIDAQKLKAECTGKDAMLSNELLDCVANQTDTAPISAQSCGSVSGKGRPEAVKGQR